MKDYIISVIIVSVCSGFATRIIPENSNSGTGKSIKFLCMLCVVSTLILPLAPALKNYSSIKSLVDSFLSVLDFEYDSTSEDYENMFNQSLNNVTTECVEDSVKKLLNEKFNISFDNMSVKAEIFAHKDGKYYISQITVILSDNAVWKNPYRIEELIKSTYGCDCIVKSS